MEHCIVYFSSSVSLFQEADLVSLLEQSQSHNTTVGITGILLINRGSIVQVLEGKKEIIEALYERIEKDQRHTDVVKIVSCSIEKRSFSDWSMDCKSITTHQLELIKTIVDLGDVNGLVALPSTNIIVNMLKSVYQSDLHDLLRVAIPVVPNLLQNHIQEWKQHYKQFAQAVQAIEADPTNRTGQSGELDPVLSEVDKEQRIEELMHLFDQNRLLIWERQQRELGQEYILV